MRRRLAEALVANGEAGGHGGSATRAKVLGETSSQLDPGVSRVSVELSRPARSRLHFSVMRRRLATSACESASSLRTLEPPSRR